MTDRPPRDITVTPHRGTVAVRFAGAVVARSARALALREAGYPEVLYIPLADVLPGALERSGHVTACPYKGEATYWHLIANGRRADNAVWGYETPFASLGAIAGHVAFYPDRVDAIAADDP